jgi:beta-phosphoglucomutase-like phosphatase (HAD superfamily)
MSKLKLVIFDCDGVMFDSKEANRLFYNQLLTECKRPPMNEEELEYVHSHNVMDSVNHIFRQYPSEEIDRANAYRRELDYTDFIRYMIMEPDLKDFLSYLKPTYHTAISTNRTTTMPAILEKFELASFFDKVVTAFDVARPKPYPDALLAILDYFDTTVEESIFIGDSMVDKEHADSVGMRLIAFKNPALPAQYHVNSFMAITQLPFFRS